MLNHLSQLASNDAFRERAAGLAALARESRIQPLDPLFDFMRRFTAGRRREARLALLEKADREIAAEWKLNRERLPAAISGFSEALQLLTEQSQALRPLIVPALDDILTLASEEAHPLRGLLREAASSFGFSDDETNWLFGELARIQYRLASLLCAGGFEDFETLLSCISAGESGLLVAGFARFTGDPPTDEKIQALVLRLREKEITASVFLVMAIILTAHSVATNKLNGKPKPAEGMGGIGNV